MEEIEFLRRLYDLKSMPSLNSRFPDAESDILQLFKRREDSKKFVNLYMTVGDEMGRVAEFKCYYIPYKSVFKIIGKIDE